MTTMRPMRASDVVDEAKIRWPKLVFPKIDGVRGVNLFGEATGRSLRKHANVYTTSRFSSALFKGFDGEMAAAEATHPNLCSLTTSALNSEDGSPDIKWHLFDFISETTFHHSYQWRLDLLRRKVEELRHPDLLIVEGRRVTSLGEMLEYEEELLEAGYEGVILRDPEGAYKFGTSTMREQGMLRVKRFIEEDALVVGISEGRNNQNPSKKNLLGRTERSTHKENMVPNGMVGTLHCRLLKDMIYRGKVLFPEGMDIDVSPGKMTDAQAREFMKNPDLILNSVIKVKVFPRGGKDKPRFPTFQSIRAKSDMPAE